MAVVQRKSSKLITFGLVIAGVGIQLLSIYLLSVYVVANRFSQNPQTLGVTSSLSCHSSFSSNEIDVIRACIRGGDRCDKEDAELALQRIETIVCDN